MHQEPLGSFPHLGVVAVKILTALPGVQPLGELSKSGDICIPRWPSLEFQRIPQEEAAGFWVVALEAHSCRAGRLGVWGPQTQDKIEKDKGITLPRSYYHSQLCSSCPQPPSLMYEVLSWLPRVSRQARLVGCLIFRERLTVGTRQRRTRNMGSLCSHKGTGLCAHAT